VIKATRVNRDAKTPCGSAGRRTPDAGQVTPSRHAHKGDVSLRLRTARSLASGLYSREAATLAKGFSDGTTLTFAPWRLGVTASA
jgi:hypothetical protein